MGSRSMSKTNDQKIKNHIETNGSSSYLAAQSSLPIQSRHTGTSFLERAHSECLHRTEKPHQCAWSALGTVNVRTFMAHTMIAATSGFRSYHSTSDKIQIKPTGHFEKFSKILFWGPCHAGLVDDGWTDTPKIFSTDIITTCMKCMRRTKHQIPHKHPHDYGAIASAARSDAVAWDSLIR